MSKNARIEAEAEAFYVHRTAAAQVESGLGCSRPHATPTYIRL